MYPYGKIWHVEKSPDEISSVDEKPVDNVDKFVDNPLKLVFTLWVKNFFVYLYVFLSKSVYF